MKHRPSWELFVKIALTIVFSIRVVLENEA